MSGRLIYLMGPSGSGKDSLIDAAAVELKRFNCRVARRVITRSAESVGEDAVSVSSEAFAHLKEEGAFALSWSANGLDYGIPAQIDAWLAEDQHVLVNGSRAHLQQARDRYPHLLAILLTVDIGVLRERLLRRGREPLDQVEGRLQRNQSLKAIDANGADRSLHYLDNSARLSDAVTRLTELLEKQLSVAA